MSSKSVITADDMAKFKMFMNQRKIKVEKERQNFEEKKQLDLINLQMIILNYLENNSEQIVFEKHNSMFYYQCFLGNFFINNPDIKFIRNNIYAYKSVNLDTYGKCDIWEKVFQEFVKNDKNVKAYIRKGELSKKWWYI